MPRLTRRAVIGAASALAAPAIVRAQSLGGEARVTVIGAGAFGAWTAEHLRRGGAKVLLLDAWGPAHARASSGGESRMTRGAYGKDAVYTKMALDSLAEWKALSARAGLPIFHRTGVLFFFSTPDPYVADSLAVHRRLGLPTEALDPAEMRRRWPQIDFAGVETGLFEPEFGPLMARRAMQTLVATYVPAGGLYEQADVLPPTEGRERLSGIRTRDGRTIEGDAFVFACGPWLPKVFPGVLGRRIFPTRQEVFFFAPKPGDRSFEPDRFPGWADFDAGDIFYGFPDLEGRGFKIANDKHGPAFDPDGGDRTPSAAALAEARAYMERRFPALAGRPLNEARVCQYENSANGDLLIDFHPRMRNVLLVGAGSGHGFKHGPEVGSYAAGLVTGSLKQREPRFSLASKGETQARDVH
jgi:glycine/D-amino acid oxidase-like deaminating enzyme